MTTYELLNSIARPDRLTDPRQALDVFDFVAREIMWHGQSGQSVMIGPEGGAKDLRVDIDVDAGRAALTWLADETIAVELARGDPLEVVWNGDAPLQIIPPGMARVSVPTARQVIADYVATGERPRLVEWVAAPAEAAALPRGMFYRGDA
ncbi:Imm1 family immunity protein [Dactylosporangium sp. NBC_01737]|uniref:Imm1 family immunity protein n=1 Tax=Dactylosporangium sp. NBC_01737 TaxID=2975959 RepID=UPI002E144E40|nr:Imm1 family immunity protein [Dactylosporangium sp. NBC_01737]